jgi:hypothetical protein
MERLAMALKSIGQSANMFIAPLPLNEDIDSLCGYPKGTINFSIRLPMAVQIAIQ